MKICGPNITGQLRIFQFNSLNIFWLSTQPSSMEHAGGTCSPAGAWTACRAGTSGQQTKQNHSSKTNDHLQCLCL